MIRLAFLAGALALAGCASAPLAPEPIVRTVTVDVPTPVRCSPKLSPKPAFGDTDAELRALLNPEDRYQALAVARPLHYAWEGELEAAVQACSAGP